MKNSINLILRRLYHATEVIALCNCATNRVNDSGRLIHYDRCIHMLLLDVSDAVKNQQEIINKLMNDHTHREDRLQLLEKFVDELKELDEKEELNNIDLDMSENNI